MKCKTRLHNLGILVLVGATPMFAAAEKGSLRSDLMAQSGVVEAQFLYEQASFPSCHASTIAETRDYFVAAFFGGTDEGNKDVGIWICTKSNTSVTTTPMLPRTSAQRAVVSSFIRSPCARGSLMLSSKSV